MGEKVMDCIFCNLKEGRVAENDLAFAVPDKYPASLGHTLIITKRHCETFFDGTIEEHTAIADLLCKVKKILDKKHKPDGYNIEVNCGKHANQHIMHLHVHLIPRYKDKVDPREKITGLGGKYARHNL